MTARDRKDIEASLEGKGFVRVETHHHLFVYWTIDGKKSRLRTRTSHGSSTKTIGDSLLAQMAKQVGLTKVQFIGLIECPLSRQAYENLITDKK